MPLSEFVRSAGRAIPVLLLLDNSGSMEGPKIAALNNAVRETLEEFRTATRADAEIKVAIVTFGGTVEKKCDFQNPGDILDGWQDLVAGGPTPLGEALDLGLSMIENRLSLGHSNEPILIVLSDGRPTATARYTLDHPGLSDADFHTVGEEAFDAAIARLNGSHYGSRAQRLGLVIGDDAEAFVILGRLKRAGNAYDTVLTTKNVGGIRAFFDLVTRVSLKTLAQPNRPQKPTLASDQSDLVQAADLEV